MSGRPKLGSLFSGYGGLEMGVAAVLDTETAWVSDVDPGACKILAHRYPDAPNLGDITAVDWSAVEPIDVLTGGFPCQDVSPAGKLAGLRPGTRSGLWSYMAYAVAELRPSLVVIENVRGLLSAGAHSDVEPCPWCLGDDTGEPALRALGAVLGDLADLGYDAAWHGLRAADIGAPHGRFRVFVVATDTQDVGHERGRGARDRWAGPADSGIKAVAHSGSAGRSRGQERDVDPSGRQPAPLRDDLDGLAVDVDWGDYAPAINGWATALGRPAPLPWEFGRVGPRRLNPAFVEWMQGLPEGHVVDVPGATRSEQLKALGNGVVPQQAAAGVRVALRMLSSAGVAA